MGHVHAACRDTAGSRLGGRRQLEKDAGQQLVRADFEEFDTRESISCCMALGSERLEALGGLQEQD